MFIGKYDHERIERNIQGVIKSNPKGNIRDLGAVMANAIDNDTYLGEAEELAKAKEREQAKKQAKWEKQQKEQQEQEERNRNASEKIAKLAEIRYKKSKEELIAVFDDVWAKYRQNNETLTDEMVAELETNGIPKEHFTLYRFEHTRKVIKYIQ